MTFEATLQSIDASLKALVVMAQTNAGAVHTFGAAESEQAAAGAALVIKAARKAKAEPAATVAVEVPAASKQDILGLVDGHPSGTRYWLIEKHNTVYAQTPGEVDCTIAGAVITTAAEYLAKKAEFAKKSVIQPKVEQPITPPAVASTPVATASPASLPGATTSFKDVTDKLIELSKDARPGKGREALVALLAKYMPAVEASARKVPALAALGKNDEIMAEVIAMLAPDAVEAETDIFG